MATPEDAPAAPAAGAGDLFASLFADLPIRVGLLLRAQTRSIEAVTAMAGRKPAQKRHFGLSELGDRYGAPADAVETVRVFAKENGLEVVSANRSGRLAVLEGSGSAVRDAFDADLEAVPHGSGHRHRARSPVAVPEALEGCVESVFGLDSLPAFGRSTRPHERVTVPDAAPVSGTAPRPSMSPETVAARYRFPTQYRGAGRTLAILVLGGGYHEEDLRAFFGDRMPDLQVVEVAGARNDPAPRSALEQFLDELAAGTTPSATGAELDQIWWTLETTVDIQLAGSFAPDAQLVLYFAPNTSLGKLEGITAVLTDEIHDPDVLSCSWGAREAGLDRWLVHALDELFQLAALRGISLCYSSGDKGADLVDGQPSAHFPASSPHALTCGGTALGSEGPETAWDESQGDQVLATGGGFSQYFARPVWQTGVPDAPDGKPRYGVPDAAGKADYAEGYGLILGGRSIRGGGTSSAAPMWAGLVTRLCEALGTRVGWLTPSLYAHARVLQPVAPAPGEPVSIEWSSATGLGSPDGEALLRALEQE